MQDKINMAKHLSKDTEGFKRQFDSAKRDADVLGKEFNDKYQKLSESMGRDSALVELKSKSAIASITQLKSELGGISEIDDDFRRWKKDMADLSKEVLSTRNDILKLTNQLNIIEANKSITVERKAKAIDEVSKSANDTKKRTNRIKEVLNKTADEIRNRKEGNVTGDTDEQ
jgi:chromosome segregation ATPase